MRSPYFHKFTPNILGDAWFWFVIVVTLAMVAIGYWQSYLRVRKGWTHYVKVIESDGCEHIRTRKVPSIRGRMSFRTVNVMFGMLLILFSVLLIKGSGDGILQFFDNALVGNESPFWSTLLAGGAIVAVDFIIGFIWLIAFCLGGTLKEKKLKKIQRAMKFDDSMEVIDRRAV